MDFITDLRKRKRSTSCHCCFDKKQILDRLPLGSLARLACACKFWSSSIDSIISRRLEDELHRRTIKLDELCLAVAAQRDEFEGPAADARRERLKGMLDEIGDIMTLPDDIDCYLAGIGLKARGLVGEVVAGFDALMDHAIVIFMSALDLVDATGAMQEGVAAA